MLIDDEADARIFKASTAFGRLRKNVWERQGRNLQTKLIIYKTVVMTTLLYACETWTVYYRHTRKLNRFHINWLRILLSITWHDMIPDTEVLESAGLQSIHALLKKAQLRWAGHVVRISVERLPKRLLYGEQSEGRRSTGGQIKRYKNFIKSSQKAFQINNDFWENLTAERGTWRSLIRKGAESYEQARIRQAEEKRLLRKSSAVETGFAIIIALPCSNCDRTFRARIGLIRHIRTHRLHATDQ